jgi:hypothetical protein
VTLRIRQYVYFSLGSDTVSAEELTAQIGMAPDTVSVRGSQRTDPPRPRSHAWRVECRTPGLTVDEQLDVVLARLEPYRSQIRRAVSQGDGSLVTATLQVVRHLDDPDGEPDGYQHRLLGWHVSRAVLAFAAETGAEIDVDEYGIDDPEG